MRLWYHYPLWYFLISFFHFFSDLFIPNMMNHHYKYYYHPQNFHAKKFYFILFYFFWFNFFFFFFFLFQLTGIHINTMMMNIIDKSGMNRMIFQISSQRRFECLGENLWDSMEKESGSPRHDNHIARP